MMRQGKSACAGEDCASTRFGPISVGGLPVRSRPDATRVEDALWLRGRHEAFAEPHPVRPRAPVPRGQGSLAMAVLDRSLVSDMAIFAALSLDDIDVVLAQARSVRFVK